MQKLIKTRCCSLFTYTDWWSSYCVFELVLWVRQPDSETGSTGSLCILVSTPDLRNRKIHYLLEKSCQRILLIKNVIWMTDHHLGEESETLSNLTSSSFRVHWFYYVANEVLDKKRWLNIFRKCSSYTLHDYFGALIDHFNLFSLEIFAWKLDKKFSKGTCQ